MTITLLPGNHDYDLACVPAYAPSSPRYNIRLEPRCTPRTIAGRTVWIEHGNQYDDFNRFPDFGNRYGLPLGYFITRGVVAAAGRSAERARSKWLDDVQSVYPNEDIPFWVLSNHFYKEMTPLLRWGLLPFLLLFTPSAAIFGLRAMERLGGGHTGLFDIDLQPILGFPGRIIDLVQFVNSAVIATLLILAVPLWFLMRDLRAALERYGISRGERLHLEKDEQYVAAAGRIFAADPSVAAFVYGHTHIPSQREVDGRYVINTGTWLKRLEYVPVRIGRLPGVYVPSYQLNWFELDEADGASACGTASSPRKRRRPHVARAAAHPGPSYEAASSHPRGDVRRRPGDPSSILTSHPRSAHERDYAARPDYADFFERPDRRHTPEVEVKTRADRVTSGNWFDPATDTVELRKYQASE